jgi:nucleolar protein 53
MSALVEAPSQFKQPSRKGKKAWRKNVDVTEVQEGLRLLKDEEIKGYVPSNGLLSRKPFPDLWTDII